MALDVPERAKKNSALAAAYGKTAEKFGPEIVAKAGLGSAREGFLRIGAFQEAEEEQGLKPDDFYALSARLKPCPDTCSG